MCFGTRYIDESSKWTRAFLLSVLASALHQQCWMKATVEDAASRRLQIYKMQGKMFNYSQKPKEMHHAAHLSIFTMGCVMSPFIMLLRNAAPWLIALHMDVRHRSGMQMLTLNSKRWDLKRFDCTMIVAVDRTCMSRFHSNNPCFWTTLLNLTWLWEVPVYQHLDVIKMY